MLVLLVSIAFTGIFQIQQLSETVNYLGRHNLIMQEAILQMRIANSLWTSGIRNFALWETDKALESLPATVDYVQTQEQAKEKFDHYLSVYSSHSQSLQQEKWVKRLKNSEAKLRQLGKQIVELLSKKSSKKQAVKRLLITFENRFYKIDNFLNEPLGKDNLKRVANQLASSRAYKNWAILLLSVFSILSIFTGMVIVFFVYRSRKLERRKKEMLLQQLMKIEEDERKSLSFQLHNEMGQDLSALKIHLALVEKKLPKALSQELSRNIGQSKDLLAKLIKTSHNIAYFLRPAALDETGIVATIEALIVQYRRSTGINFNFRKPKQDLKLSSQYNLLLYRIVQEAFTNIAKHSKASNVDIEILRKGKIIKLEVKDDGVGFDYNRRKKYGFGDKLGLLSLQERIELFGGSMHIHAAVGKGTQITVWL